MTDAALRLSRQLEEYLNAHKEEVTADLRRLVEIPSVKGEASENAPNGKACAQALREACALFGESGMQTKVYAKEGFALAHTVGSTRKIGIFTHTDVVPAGEGWEYGEPFALTAHPNGAGDTVLIGRGAEDNKGGVVSALWALKALRAANALPKSTVEVFFGSDEECGMSDMQAYRDLCTPPAVSLVPDNDYPVCIGEKGICQMLAKSNKCLQQITSFAGGEAYNAVLASVTVTGTDAALCDELVAATRGCPDACLEQDGNGGFSLRVRGVTAHASRPEGSRNAAKAAAELLLSCGSLCENDRTLLQSLCDMLGDCYGACLGIAAENPISGKLTVANGIVRTDAEKHLSFSLDIRYGAGDDSGEMLSALERTFASHGFAVEECHDKAGCLVAPDSPLVLTILDTYKTVTGETEAKPYISGGGTYARSLPNAVSFGMATPAHKITLALRDGHGSVHQPDEALSLNGLLEGIRLLALFILACDEADAS